jgi:hypothetical protein
MIAEWLPGEHLLVLELEVQRQPRASPNQLALHS